MGGVGLFSEVFTDVGVVVGFWFWSIWHRDARLLWLPDRSISMGATDGGRDRSTTIGCALPDPLLLLDFPDPDPDPGLLLMENKDNGAVVMSMDSSGGDRG